MKRIRLWPRLLHGLLILSLVLSIQPVAPARPVEAAHEPISYIYDAAGRLRAVTDPHGDTGEYVYDTVGNITSILRRASSATSIIELAPNRGPVGTTVTISGSGFSATPSQNTVTFNGTAATVTSSTLTRIVTTVPSGATTGTVAVTAPGGSATSSSPFTVTAPSLGVPTISSFTPTLIDRGSTVTVSGTNFEASTATNVVTVNGARTTVNSATATSMAIVAPSATNSGRIVVRTPAGNATSGGHLFIPPGALTAADVVGTGSVALGGSQSVTIGTSNKVGLMAFDGTAGQKISLTMTASYTWTWLSIYNPDGSGLITGQLLHGGGTGFIDVLTLPATGTYAVLLDPDSTSTGNVTVNLYEVPADVTNTITIGGSAVAVTTTVPGQNAKLTFSGTSGQRISLRMSNSSFPNTCGYLGILKPDNSVLAQETCMLPSGTFIDTQTLPTTGTYTIRIDPGGPGTGSMTFTLYLVPANVSGTMTLGTGFNVNVTTPGQDVGLTFSGTSGNRLFLHLTNANFANQCQWIGIYKPDNSLLLQDNCMLPGGFYFDTTTLPATGTYRLDVDMKNGVTGTYTLTAYDVPPDVGTSLTVGASAVNISMSIGQNASLPFTASSGQRIRLSLSNKNIPWACSWGGVAYGPTPLVAEWCLLPGGTTILDTPVLSNTGTHHVFLNLPGAHTGNLDVAVSLISASLFDDAFAHEEPPRAGVELVAARGPEARLATLSFRGASDEDALVLNEEDGEMAVSAAGLQQPGTPLPTATRTTPAATPTLRSTPSATATPVRTATGAATAPINPLTATPEPMPSVGTPAPRTRPSEEQPLRLDHHAPPEQEWVPDARNLKGYFTTRPGTTPQESPYERLTLPRSGPGVTALAGRALKLNGEPLEGVTLRIKDQSTRTDEGGRFLLEKVDPGHQVLAIDGTTVNQPGRSYGIFHAGVDIQAGQTNELGYTIWMPLIDRARAQRVASPTTSEIVITSPRLPGLELHIPAGSTITAADGRLVTDIGLTAMPTDKPAFPIPGGVGFPVYFTIQPGGAYVSGQGAYLVYPNYSDETPGTRMNFWHYDPNGRGWYVYGKGSVSPDGRQIVPDPGVRIYEFTGAMVAPEELASDEGKPPGGGAAAGEPVDMSTGLFIMEKVDLALGGLMPISLVRTYLSKDTRSRAFGIGATHPYDIFLTGDVSPWTYQELILADGGRIRFNRINSGTSYADGIFEHTSSPTAFYKARMTWNGAGWDLKLMDGTILKFRDGYAAVRPQQAAMIAIHDRNGNALSLVRDTNYNLTAIRSPSGRWIELTYDTSFRVTQARDNIGRTVGYQYDASGRLWKVTDTIAGVTEYTYDASHRMLTIKDPRNITYLTNAYDANGRVSTQTQADNTAFQFAYTLDGNGKVTRADVTDPRGFVRRVDFNASGYKTSEAFALGQAVAQTYTFERVSGTNQLSAVVDALSRRTTFNYDSAGNVVSTTGLAGTADAFTTSMTYESTYGQIASVTDPLNHTTNFAYDATGNLTTITDPLNHQTTFAYNTAGQPTTISNALSHSAQLGYELGDIVNITDPLSRVTKLFFDNAGRLITVTDALGQVARTNYDTANRVTSLSDPLGSTTTFTHDANGNLLTVTDARNNTTTYTYDSLDRLTSRVDPLTRAESYTYNANGDLASATDRKNQTTSFTYDGLGRRTQTAYADASTTSFTYDAGNRLTQAVDSVSGTISLVYDSRSRLTSETTPEGTVSYTYDAANRKTGLTVAGQTQVTYNYDNADRLTGVTQGTASASYTYDNADRLTQLTLPNGIRQEYSYDNASQVTGIAYKLGANTLGDLSYGYDLVARRISIGGSYARTSIPTAVASAAYNANNQLTAWGGTALSYDNNGNLTNDGANTYVWNARNQLASIAGGTTANFRYDAFERRRGKTVAGTSTDFLYDGINAVQELSGGAPTANLLTGLGIDDLVSRVDSVGARYALTDALGSVIALTDGAGAVQTEYTYEPFGKATAGGGTNTNSYQFTSRENDEATGLYFYRARYYNPRFARFISEDPIGFGGGDINLYAYVRNSPLSLVDPLGLQGVIVPGPGGAVVVPGGRGGFGGVSPQDVAKAAAAVAAAKALAELAARKAQQLLNNGANALRDAANQYQSSRSGGSSLDANLKVLKDKDHLDAAKREKAGEVVKRKPDGTPYNHIEDVQNAMNGVKNRIQELQRRVGDSRTSPAEREALRKELGELSRLLDNVEKFLGP